MSQIIIDRIEFENYRQYGTGYIDFDIDRESKLSVLVAQNGTGKTTFLNAITWCLYKKELQISDIKASLPLPNSAAIKKAKAGTTITVSVKIVVIDGDHIIEFKRSVDFKVVSPKKQLNSVIEGPGHFSVTITDRHDFTNTVVKNGEDADIVVKQYFDEAIFNFYFFDGEKLKEFFADERSQVIRNSVFNISQVTMLESACTHLRHMRTAQGKKLGKEAPDITILYTERDEEKKQIKAAKENLTAAKAAVKKANEEIEAINAALSGYAPIKKYQDERAELEAALDSVKDEATQLASDRADFIRKYTILLNLYPRIKHTLAVIYEKESKGELPPAIDRDQVQELVKSHAKTCPLCDCSLDEKAFEHLQELLEKLSVSSHTSNYLKEIKSTLESAIDEAKKYREKRKKLDERAKDISAREDKTRSRLKEINGILSKYDSESGKVDVPKLEKRRETLTSKRNNALRMQGAAENTIETAKKSIEAIESEIEDFEKKISAYNETKQIVGVLDSLIKQFEIIKENIMAGIRTEIESRTWSIFDSMIWKRNTFGSVAINENYEITVYNTEGVRMTGSLSATEQMALAYAYTLAIHNASGRNCPLVIDSPLGRVSDTNRENMAKVLRDVSADKQIIMLFTPDEYSDSVKALYHGVAEVRELHLSSDEAYVEGVDR